MADSKRFELELLNLSREYILLIRPQVGATAEPTDEGTAVEIARGPHVPRTSSRTK